MIGSRRRKIFVFLIKHIVDLVMSVQKPVGVNEFTQQNKILSRFDGCW